MIPLSKKLDKKIICNKKGDTLFCSLCGKKVKLNSGTNREMKYALFEFSNNCPVEMESKHKHRYETEET